ncbi:MAG: hypothetical protein OEX22_09435 [Cyclobacteriaceae bacterium]|nr:hypothetical protein [Cyclobacteriaceae bacterium]
MKNLIFASTIIGTLTSCSYDEVLDSEQYPQKWKLIEMSGNIANVPPSTGSDMTWQEEYLLYSDNTFIKSRERGNVVMEEIGTFDFVILSDGKYLELIYESDNDLIGNCTSKAEELLKLSSDNKLTGTWQACDGPGLVYKRIE